MSLCMNIGTLLQTSSPDTEIFKYEQIQEKKCRIEGQKKLYECLYEWRIEEQIYIWEGMN